MILDGDIPVYWRSTQLSAADGDSWGGARFDGLPAEPGDYVINARFDSQPESEWERFDCGEYDVSIWYSGNPSNCNDS